MTATSAGSCSRSCEQSGSRSNPAVVSRLSIHALLLVHCKHTLLPPFQEVTNTGVPPRESRPDLGCVLSACASRFGDLALPLARDYRRSPPDPGSDPSGRPWEISPTLRSSE